MSIVQVELAEDIKRLIERQIAEGRAASETDFISVALRRYAEDLAADDDDDADLFRIAEQGIADIEAGRFSMIATTEDAQALHGELMDAVRSRLRDDR